MCVCVCVYFSMLYMRGGNLQDLASAFKLVEGHVQQPDVVPDVGLVSVELGGLDELLLYYLRGLD